MSYHLLYAALPSAAVTLNEINSTSSQFVLVDITAFQAA